MLYTSSGLLFIVIGLLFIHWIGDFVCQTHWQAINKSKSIKALSIHIGTYTAVLAILTYVLFAVTNLLTITIFYSLASLIAFIVANGVLHFITDYVTSKINAHLWETKQIHEFFTMIGFDQFLHYAALLGTLWFFIL